MAFHWEEREAEVSELVVARGGPKLQRALGTDAGTDSYISVDGKQTALWSPISDPEERARIKGMTMDEFVQWLPSEGSTPVVDKTGLEGRFKIDLRYSSPELADRPGADPPIDVALADLGLRLEKRKGLVRIPVLDHIEAPDAN
jgi:uncharacterized protein (TIGR03435 family)